MGLFCAWSWSLCWHSSLLYTEQSSHSHCHLALWEERDDMLTYAEHIQTTSVRTKDFILTRQLKAREEALEEVLAWVWHGNRAEFRHHNAVMLKVFLVAITVEEAAHVRHLSILNVELVHKRHTIKPVIETEEQTQTLIYLLWSFWSIEFSRSPDDAHLLLPISNFPGPFLRKLPLIQEGMLPVIVVVMGSGVSSAEHTRFSMHGRPWTSVKCWSLFCNLVFFQPVGERRLSDLKFCAPPTLNLLLEQ